MKPSQVILRFFNRGDLLDLVRPTDTRTNSIDAEGAHMIASQIASAVDAIHDTGIVHRDIKLENIFVGEKKGYYNFALGDFDLAGRPQLTLLVGTHDSMPQEVRFPCFPNDNVSAEEKEQRDRAKDYWSFGVLIHQLLVSALFRTFSSSTGDSLEVYRKMKRGQYNEIKRDDLEQLRPLLGVMERCLTFDPIERFKEFPNGLSADPALQRCKCGCNSHASV